MGEWSEACSSCHWEGRSQTRLREHSQILSTVLTLGGCAHHQNIQELNRPCPHIPAFETREQHCSPTLPCPELPSASCRNPPAVLKHSLVCVRTTPLCTGLAHAALRG